jgi:hypothetical protein
MKEVEVTTDEYIADIALLLNQTHAPYYNLCNESNS